MAKHLLQEKNCYKKYCRRLTAALLLAGAVTLSGLSEALPAAAMDAQPTGLLISPATELPGTGSQDVNLAANWPQGPAVTAESAILIEADTGTILYAKDIHKQQYPASCTKILTCLIAAERCKLDEMVTMSKSAVFDTPRDSNHIALDVGEAITMEEALNAILIRSANEVAFAVGEHISQSTWQDFGPIMNERAAELGCLNSNFVNPNGLPDENHYTTAYDLAVIARSFFANEMLAKISRTTRLELFPTDTQPDHIIENTKTLLLPGQSMAYEHLVGCKTGYTNAARSCLVACAEKDGMRLISVVLRDDSPEQYKDTIALLDYGFANFTMANVSQSETKYQLNDNGMFYADNDIFGSSNPLLSVNTKDCVVLPITADFADLESTISYDTEYDNQAALITYSFDGIKVGTASVDFLGSEKQNFTFDALENDTLPGEDAYDSALSDKVVPGEGNDAVAAPSNEPTIVFVNILRAFLWGLAALAALAVLVFLIVVLARTIRRSSKHRARQRRWKRRYRRR